jgi:hypothetical protein
VYSDGFLVAMQRRTARCAIGPSTLRGQGAPGAVAAARLYLEALPLRPFGARRATVFRQRLDAATAELQARMPRGARRWGTARKALNIFLRDALYSAYLRDAYRLAPAEPLLELPLDSITARYLALHSPRRALPRWPGVRNLTPETSDAFQAAARRVAAARGVAVVHLDAYWWGGDRKFTAD